MIRIIGLIAPHQINPIHCPDAALKKLSILIAPSFDVLVDRAGGNGADTEPDLALRGEPPKIVEPQTEPLKNIGRLQALRDVGTIFVRLLLRRLPSFVMIERPEKRGG